MSVISLTAQMYTNNGSCVQLLHHDIMAIFYKIVLNSFVFHIQIFS